jgi:hypothetical protein
LFQDCLVLLDGAVRSTSASGNLTQLLQLVSQGAPLLGPGGRLGVDDGGNSHMVRRHGVLPERMVTREMLKQVGAAAFDVLCLSGVFCCPGVL